MAEGHAPHRARRARVHAQVEHGLDARHARLLQHRSGAPPLAPPRADVRAAVRVQRAVRAAAQPRRGGARQGQPARQDARRRLAAVRQPACAVRVDVGDARRAAGVHGRRAGAVDRVERRRRPAVAPARPRPAPRCPRSAGRAQRESPTQWPVAVGARSRADRLPMARRRRRRCTRSSRSCGGVTPAPQAVACVANFTPVPRPGYRVGSAVAGRVAVLVDTDSAPVRRQRATAAAIATVLGNHRVHRGRASRPRPCSTCHRSASSGSAARARDRTRSVAPLDRQPRRPGERSHACAR